jgi:hypothetical protein
MAFQCFMDYFDKAENIVDEWLYISMINVHVYNEWWQQNNQVFEGQQ